MSQQPIEEFGKLHWPGTKKFVGIVNGICLFCSKEGICLSCDNSDWEYEDIQFCFSCVRILFEEVASLRIVERSSKKD